MNNIMIIGGHKAVIKYDPEIDMFRGEFVNLSGGADFYAADVNGLKTEGSLSLKIYLEACKEKGIAPYKSYSGRFNLRISADLHAAATAAASAEGKSLNTFIADAIAKQVQA